jgi:hypothetical protein
MPKTCADLATPLCNTPTPAATLSKATLDRRARDLVRAAADNDVERVHLLLARGADPLRRVRCRNIYGRLQDETALDVAARSEAPDALRTLCATLEPDDRGIWHSAIGEAVGADRLENVQILLHRLGERDGPRALDAVSSLVGAAGAGPIACIEALLRFALARGATPQRLGVALARAALNGHPDCVRALLPHADPNGVDRFDGDATTLMRLARPLDAAPHKNARRIECLHLLAPHSDANRRLSDDSRAGQKKDTALMIAVRASYPDAVEALVPVSDLTLLDARKRNALDIALDSRDPGDRARAACADLIAADPRTPAAVRPRALRQFYDARANTLLMRTTAVEEARILRNQLAVVGSASTAPAAGATSTPTQTPPEEGRAPIPADGGANPQADARSTPSIRRRL